MEEITRPRIVFLDGATLDPGDNPLQGLDDLGIVEAYPRSSPEEISLRCAKADIIVTNKAPVSRETIAAAPHLRFIAVTATGSNIVDTEAAKEHGIAVSNVPVYGTTAVAQFTFALLLELCHHVGRHSELVHKGDWVRSPDFCFWETPQVELSGLTLAVIGAGRIGQGVAELGRAFGMNAVTLGRKDDVLAAVGQADVVSLHCPLTPETEGLVGASFLARMKPSAFLLNTSRGGLVDEAALACALRAGEIAGAAVDVVSDEPMPENCPLLGVTNCIITPHIAWATLAARQRLARTTIENIQAFLDGQPKNCVA